MKSIRSTLLYWLTGSLVIGMALTAWLTFRQAQQEADNLFDYQMEQLAVSLPNLPFEPVEPQRMPNHNEQIIIQIWDSNGLRIYGSHRHPGLPQWAELGFSTVNTPGGDWRVYGASLDETVVQIAQPLKVRRMLAASIAMRTVAPMLLLFPLMAFFIWLAVRRGLAPILRLTGEVKRRDSQSLDPIENRKLPEEITPLTHALNGLLARLDTALTAQRDFVADAAHELRSPLTALQLQVQLAERADNTEARQIAFANLKSGLARANHLVQQLLTLARQEPGAFPQAQGPVPLDQLAASTVADFSLQAGKLGIDLGIAITEPVTVAGQTDSLRILLGNLIDNALRYTPAPGRIDVSISQTEQGAALLVADSGPGIPADELPRVLDRFYRVAGSKTEGSGLGLAIVQQIATAHHAKLELANRPEGGLLAKVVFPDNSTL